jgi:hypothetical protein
MRRDTLPRQAGGMDTTPLAGPTTGAPTPLSTQASGNRALGFSALLAGLLPLVGNGLYAGPTGDGGQLLADAQGGPPGIAYLAYALELGGFVALCVLLATLTTLLHPRSPVAAVTTAVAGAGMVAVKIASVTPTMALAAEADQLDAPTAQLAQAVNGAGFVACGFLLGVALAAAGAGILRSGTMARWVGWWAAVAGSGAVVAGAHGIVAPPAYVPVPFLLLLLWMITVGVTTLAGSLGRSAGAAAV